MVVLKSLIPKYDKWAYSKFYMCNFIRYNWAGAISSHLKMFNSENTYHSKGLE